MKDRFICTNQHHTTVHLYLYLYLHLYVQCNAVAVTVAPFFLFPPDLTLEVGVATGALVSKLQQTTLTRHNRPYKQLAGDRQVNT